PRTPTPTLFPVPTLFRSQREGQVVAGATEHRMRLDVHPHVQIARGRAAPARLALTGQPDALVVVHPGGDAHRQRPRARTDALAPALGARVLDPHPLATAVTARFRERERALATAHQARPTARRTRARARSRPRAVTAARATGGGTRQPQRQRRAPYGLDEVDADVGLD